MTWFAPKPGERILDAGFGQGQALKFIANWVGPNGRAIGIEPNLEKVAALDDELRSEGPVSPVGLVGNADELPFDDGTFDAVICVNVLEAVVNRGQAVKEMRRGVL